jgi:CheY-like chemotaxis protein
MLSNVNNMYIDDFLVLYNNDSYSQQNFNTRKINILVADDETFTRQSIVRILYSLSNELKLEVNIVEAKDGYETLHVIYKSFINGFKISLIFSDENMTFMNGSKSFEILVETFKRLKRKIIPFYLVTAYDSTLMENQLKNSFSGILSKPLNIVQARTIMNSLINSYH